jgi:hypothetical protein
MVPSPEVVQRIVTLVDDVIAVQPLMSHFTIMIDIVSMKS